MSSLAYLVKLRPLSGITIQSSIQDTEQNNFVAEKSLLPSGHLYQHCIGLATVVWMLSSQKWGEKTPLPD